MGYGKGHIGTSMHIERLPRPKKNKVEKPKKVRMLAKFDSTCCACQKKVVKDSPILWLPGTKKVWHSSCSKVAQ